LNEKYSFLPFVSFENKTNVCFILKFPKYSIFIVWLGFIAWSLFGLFVVGVTHFPISFTLPSYLHKKNAILFYKNTSHFIQNVKKAHMYAKQWKAETSYKRRGDQLMKIHERVLNL
jgi:hypothetical protein